MNDTVKTIISRRSVRAFEDRAIPKEVLETIIECACSAPSGMNLQTWHFTVIQNKEIISRLAKTVAKILGRDENYNFYKPDVMILVSNKKDSRFSVEDSSCALQNIFLSAASMGVGSVWINQFKGICDEKELRDILDELKIPSDNSVFGAAALGYAADNGTKAVRKTDVVDYFC